MRHHRGNMRVGQPGPLLLSLLLVGGWACHSAADNNMCRYEGSSHSLGDSFPANDGCNTCSCNSLGITCTHRTCLPDAGSPDLGSVDDASPLDASPDQAGPSDGGPADGPVTCQSGSHVYAPGVLFPSDDGCNFCSCDTQGRILCTAVFCFDGGSSGLGCNFETTYRYSDRVGGATAATQDSSTLSPPHHDQVTRTVATDGGMSTCEADLPCVDSTRVGVVAIRQALAHPDVVAALAQPSPPTYGTPSTLTPLFHFLRDDGRGFDVGSGTVPAGLQTFVDLLRQAHTETTATCAGF